MEIVNYTKFTQDVLGFFVAVLSKKESFETVQKKEKKMNKTFRLNEVVEAVGLSRSSIWRLEQVGKFPKRIKIGERAVAWDSHEINQWLDNRKALRTEA